jgi:hypothetical protein
LSRIEAGCRRTPACIHLAIFKPISRLGPSPVCWPETRCRHVIISFSPFDECAPLHKGERAGDESNCTAAAAGSAEAETVSGRDREGGQSTSSQRCHTDSLSRFKTLLTSLDQGLLTKHAGPYETFWNGRKERESPPTVHPRPRSAIPYVVTVRVSQLCFHSASVRMGRVGVGIQAGDSHF